MPRLIKYPFACVDVLPSEPHVFLILFADEVYCLLHGNQAAYPTGCCILGTLGLYQASGWKLIKSLQTFDRKNWLIWLVRQIVNPFEQDHLLQLVYAAAGRAGRCSQTRCLQQCFCSNSICRGRADVPTMWATNHLVRESLNNKLGWFNVSSPY